MAQVYLPFGYPILSGSPFETVIYQGTVTRLYDVPDDPRTDSQLFERKFLADCMKMMQGIGPFSISALQAAIGERWSNSLYQLIRGDVFAWWSDSWQEYDSFTSLNKESWGEHSLYLATFNDPGKIFFCMARVIHAALVYYTGIDWESVEWSETQAEQASLWCRGFVTIIKNYRLCQEDAEELEYVGSWSTETEAGHNGGAANRFEGGGAANVQFYPLCRHVEIGYFLDTDQGHMKMFLDGQEVEDQDLHYTEKVYQQSVVLSSDHYRYHCVKLENVDGGKINLDWIELLRSVSG